ncbi:hypothetical protein KCP75_11950 [Salmonella enterica subsp. enterica]|nr:hypothetical protein KCP75_11950 [Salmonella enterica subsp. enterica]
MASGMFVSPPAVPRRHVGGGRESCFILPWPHFDERGFGHLALGHAKSASSRLPLLSLQVPLWRTSIRRYFESVLRARSFILLTADARRSDWTAAPTSDPSGGDTPFLPHPSPSKLCRCRVPRRIFRRWLVSTIDNALLAMLHARCTLTSTLAEPLYGDMNDTGLVWQQRLGDWRQDEKPRCAKRVDWKATTKRDFGSSKTKTRRRCRRAYERGRRQKWRSGANSVMAINWRRIVANRAQAAVCADLWLATPKRLPNCSSVVQPAAARKRFTAMQATRGRKRDWVNDNIEGRLTRRTIDAD